MLISIAYGRAIAINTRCAIMSGLIGVATATAIISLCYGNTMHFEHARVHLYILTLTLTRMYVMKKLKIEFKVFFNFCGAFAIVL